ncbi:MAG TPA: hypothetical protein VES38_10740 [Methylotenera sp.]|nr:hypothetical protein [Methylotenera sp.]
MSNNQQYASNILIKASLSNNEELIDLTKKISEELHIGVDLICAIESYLNSLKTKSATRECVQDSKYFLNKLTQNLYGIHTDGVAYRRAVEALILNVEIEDIAFCINLAREFYPLWLYENNLDEIHHEHIFKRNIQKAEFTDLWNSIDQEFFSDMENWPLTLYTESMRKIGVSEQDVTTRLKVAKVITVELRNDHSSPDENYRDAINRTHHLFANEEMKEFFLIVSREFYHFWIGSPLKH